MTELMCDLPGAADVVALCQELLTIDSSNFGDNEGPVERACAEFVMAKLTEVGYAPTYLESSPGRANVILRIPGRDPSLGAVMLHGHLDVVPAVASDWQVHPLSGEERDGMLWGRGAVDMKGMDAMILAFALDLATTGRVPERDVVVAFLADEEAGGLYGSHWLVKEHRELFEGVTTAISEVGGFSIEIDGKRCYLLQTAEKGIMWLRLVAQGRAGHGSQVGTDNAVTRLCAAVTRIGQHEWPIEITPTVREFLDSVEQITGEALDYRDFDALSARLGTTARWIGATLQNTSNPSTLTAGYKHNVIPGSASALVDCRFLPGQRDEVLATMKELAGERVDVIVDHEDVSLDAPYKGAVPDAMVRSLLAEDPGAHVLPYCLSGGTDNKAFSLLGITGYGFAPLRLPKGLDFAGMFHGVDERVPADSLIFGRRVLERLVMTQSW